MTVINFNSSLRLFLWTTVFVFHFSLVIFVLCGWLVPIPEVLILHVVVTFLVLLSQIITQNDCVVTKVERWVYHNEKTPLTISGCFGHLFCNMLEENRIFHVGQAMMLFSIFISIFRLVRLNRYDLGS